MSAAEVARRIIGRLLAQGVEHVVVAPGSRSGGLALAAAAAESAGRLRLSVRLDERDAGFFAVGAARAGGAPVAVVTTSGTAVGNLLPAVMEAAHAGVPLVLVTADRPLVDHESGANQTTRQSGIFARFVRGEATLPDTADAAAVDHHVTRLVALAAGTRTSQPGPVQLNLALAMPLFEDGPLDPPELAARMVSGAGQPAPVELQLGKATVIVAGDGPPAVGAAAAELAAVTGWPLLAEPTSNARHSAAAVGAYRLLLGAGAGAEIERVVVLGRPTLSRPVSSLLARPDVELVVVTGAAEWSDPGHRASVVASGVVAEADPAALGEQWRAWDRAWQARRGEAVESGSGVAVADALWRGLRAGARLMVGSSNPIRDLDLAGRREGELAAYANRGLAGIDGVVATAAGVAASAGAGVDTHLVVGDLSLLHSSGGLWLNPHEERPRLRIWLFDDDGGSIFHGLEQGADAYAAHFERVFGTPHGADLLGLATSLGWAARTAEPEEVAGLAATPVSGPELVRIPLGRADRRAEARRLADLAGDVLG